MLKSLQGIRPARDVRERPESALEKLVKLGDTVKEEYAGKVSNDWGKNHDNIYLPLYRSLSSTLPEYTEREIQDLLLAKANNSYRDNEAQVLGMYTGVLLHVLTERLEKEGKKAVFTFDLHGNELNYLFFFAKRAGEVTVRNVKGKDTCSLLASYGGKAEKVVLEGNEGNGAASWAGSYNGAVGTLFIHGNKGDYAAYRAGSFNGTVGTLVIKDNEGDRAAYEAGSHNGKVGTLVIKDNKGDWAAFEAGWNGRKVGTLVITNNKGNQAASWAGWNGGKVGTLALYKAGTNAGDGAEATRILTGRKALALYQQLEKELPCLKAYKE